ncbi:MAG: hypothetical protein P8Y93_10065 [Acidobacteriota bacterium]
MERSPVRRRCPYCGQEFTPSPYCPRQRICSGPECQRRRRREYHREKVTSDPEYREVCRDSRQKWRARNPDYQRQYRDTHPDYVEQNRRSQRRRDGRRRWGDLVKNNLALDVKRLDSEVWLVEPSARDLVKNNVAFSELVVFQRVSSNATPSSGIL